MTKLRWGILGTANIAVSKVIPAMQKSTMLEVAAIASRDLKRAQSAAERLRISNAYGSYEELLASPEVDAVYIPLPNHLHVPWSLKAIQAGKHVLCEKPIGLDYSDAKRLENVSKEFPRLKVMEAFMYRHHPQWVKVKELIAQKTIGEIKSVYSLFSYYNDDTSNIRNIAEAGGGAMLDIGCYCTSLSRFVFGREPERVMGHVENDPHTKVDRFASALLDFGSGTAAFSTGTQMQPYQTVDIHGTQGRIEMEIPFNAPNDQPTRIWLQKGGAKEELRFDVCDQYTIQADLFAEAILGDGSVPTPIEDALANMKVIDAVKESSIREGWVEL